MKKLLSLVVVFLLIISCKNEIKEDPEPIITNTWQHLNDFPGEGRSNGSSIAFSLLGKGYYGLGGNYDEPFLRDMWRYDPIPDSWEQIGNFPHDLPAEIAVTLNENAYVMTYSGSLYEYNPVSDSWKYLTTFPEGNRPGITGFALNENIYFGTGNNVNTENFKVFNDFWEYDLTENSWIKLKNFPGTRRSHAISFVIGDIPYVGYGFNGLGAPPYYKDIWSYDVTANEWTQIADFPSSEIIGILFSSSTKAYAGIPDPQSMAHGKVYEYNPGTNAWREIARFPSGSTINTNSFTINDRLFVLGGWWSHYSKQVWEYIP